MKTLCLISCNVDSNFKLQVLKSNINYIKEVADHIVILLNNDKYLDRLDNVEVVNLHGDERLYHYHWADWLSSNSYSEYDSIILANDKFFIINSLKKLKSLFLSNKLDVCSLINSRAVKYHHLDMIKIYKSDNTKQLITYYKNIDEDHKYAKDIEINSTFLFKEVDCLYNVDLRYKNDIHSDLPLLLNIIDSDMYPVITIDSIKTAIESDNDNIKQYVLSLLSHHGVVYE